MTTTTLSNYNTSKLIQSTQVEKQNKAATATTTSGKEETESLLGQGIGEEGENKPGLAKGKTFLPRHE